MKSLGGKPHGARLERIRASPRWAGEGFRNVHPIIPGLRDPNAAMPTLSEFLCGGERRIPQAPLPSINPRQTWARLPASGLRATWERTGIPIDLPKPIAIYIAAENRGDAEALGQCFAQHAVVRDEGQTIEGLTAIKQWSPIELRFIFKLEGDLIASLEIRS